jgi:hypothetical protein
MDHISALMTSIMAQARTSAAGLKAWAYNNRPSTLAGWLVGFACLPCHEHSEGMLRNWLSFFFNRQFLRLRVWSQLSPQQRWCWR